MCSYALTVDSLDTSIPCSEFLILSRVLVTGVLADRRPASLYFFKNYELPEDSVDSNPRSPFPPPVPPSSE